MQEGLNRVEICVLGSGSAGNAIYVAAGGTRLLIDAGLRCKQLIERLAAIQVSPESITGILLTHDHIDHYQGLPVFCKRFAPMMYANEGTASGVDSYFRREKKPEPVWAVFETGIRFTCGDFEITSFPVPHDASEPVGFLLEACGKRLLVATDLGTPTPKVTQLAESCHAVILECNHDYEMLRQSGRPWDLIRRIGGPHGHLNNEDAGELIAAAISKNLSHLFLAHLSSDCNTPALARNTMLRHLRRAGREDVELIVTNQHCPTAVYVIEENIYANV